MRQTAKPVPDNGPRARIASAAYSEHDGMKRHVGRPLSGDNHRWYPRTSASRSLVIVVVVVVAIVIVVVVVVVVVVVAIVIEAPSPSARAVRAAALVLDPFRRASPLLRRPAR